MTAVAYIRVSTDEQAASGLGLADQAVRVRAYCDCRGLALTDLIEDAGHSAGIPLADRPGGARLVASLAKRGGPAHVVILNLARAFRSAVDCLTTVGRWKRRGVTLHIVDLGGASIDSSTATGKLLLTLIAAVAEMERNLTAERTAAALRQLRARGMRAGAVPYGFALDPTDPDEQRLIACDIEQSAIDDMLRMRADGLSLRTIADVLTDQHIPTKGGLPWTHQSVASVLARNQNRRASDADQAAPEAITRCATS